MLRRCLRRSFSVAILGLILCAPSPVRAQNVPQDPTITTTMEAAEADGDLPKESIVKNFNEYEWRGLSLRWGGGFLWDYSTYGQDEASSTVYGMNNPPNPAFASATVLQTRPGITPDLARQIVEQRWGMRPNEPGAQALTLPDGTAILAAGGGGTYTVKSRATLANGAWTLLDATIRLGGAPGGRAYSILRWREGSAE